MPPPLSAEPLLIVRPEIVTVFPLLIVKIPNAAALESRWTVRTLAPGPLIVTSSERLGSALCRRIVPVRPAAKVMVSAAGPR
jgi:hypothetical protein